MVFAKLPLDEIANKILRDISEGRQSCVLQQDIMRSLEDGGYVKLVKNTPRLGQIYEVTKKGKEYLNSIDNIECYG